MSPSQELAYIRALGDDILCGDFDDAEVAYKAEELALAIDYLDEMISSGMPLPIDWDKK